MNFYYIFDAMGLLYIMGIISMLFIYYKKNDVYKTREEKVRVTYGNFIFYLLIGMPSVIIILLILLLNEILL